MREARPKGTRYFGQDSLHSAPPDLHSGALGRGEPAAPSRGTCAAHVASPGDPQASGCGSSGRVVGHLGISAMEEGEGALASVRPSASSCGPRPDWQRDPRKSPEAEAVCV